MTGPDDLFGLVAPYDEQEAVIFTEALRRGVDPLLLVAMFRESIQQDVEDWAERAAMFLRDSLAEYHSNPLTTQRTRSGEAQPLRLCYDARFIEWFGQRYGKHVGQDWPRVTLQRYWAILRGEEVKGDTA